MEELKNFWLRWSNKRGEQFTSPLPFMHISEMRMQEIVEALNFRIEHCHHWFEEIKVEVRKNERAT